MNNAHTNTDVAYGSRTPMACADSAVSWPAVFSGAVIGAALTGMLVTGGAGLGFLSVSAWQGEGASGGALVTGTIVWLFVTQVIAYGVAGYVTGRLRSRWQGVRPDESFFRDTAHGFMVWALSFIVGALVLGSTAMSVVSGTAKVGASAVGAGAGAIASMADGVKSGDASIDYFTDMLLRPSEPGSAGNRDEIRREVGGIFSRSLLNGEIAKGDQDYLVKLVARHAGIDDQQARDRIGEIHASAQKALKDVEVKAREAAETARRSAAILSLWMFASMLLGAFVCSFSATVGGRARDL